MKVLINTLFSCMFFWLMPTTCFSQETENNWVPYYENEQIQVELQQSRRQDVANGIDNNYLLIRITNKTQQAVDVHFQKQLSYNLQPVTTDAITPIRLAPGEILTGSTQPESNKALRIFVNQNNGFNKNVLTDYALINFRSELIQQ